MADTSSAMFEGQFPRKIHDNGDGTFSNYVALAPSTSGTTLNPVEPDAVLDAVTVSGSQSAAAVLISASTQGFAGGSFQITNAGVGCTVSFLQSNDNINFVPMLVYAGTSTGSVTTYGSGTVAGVLAQKRVVPQIYGQSLATGGQTIGSLGASTNLVGDVGVEYRGNATGAALYSSVLSPATPVGTNIKAIAGRLVGISLQNSASTLRSVKFYNVTSVTMGTTAAVFEIDIPAGGSVSTVIEGGIGFSTAITWAVTAGKGLTDNTTTGLAANDVSGALFYA